MPPAPGLFSTTTGFPSLLCIDSARMRPMMSAPPPGPNETTMRIGCCGQSCAAAGPTAAASAAISAKNILMSILPSRLSTAPAHFLDHRAVVELGFAGAHAGLKHVGMHLEHRQFLSDRGGLIEHQLDIFQCLL